jgi:hypothetical protein
MRLARVAPCVNPHFVAPPPPPPRGAGDRAGGGQGGGQRAWNERRRGQRWLLSHLRARAGRRINAPPRAPPISGKPTRIWSCTRRAGARCLGPHPSARLVRPRADSPDCCNRQSSGARMTAGNTGLTRQDPPVGRARPYRRGPCSRRRCHHRRRCGRARGRARRPAALRCPGRSWCRGRCSRRGPPRHRPF